MPNTEKATLIYDDRCSLCIGAMKWIELHALCKDNFEFIPCRSEERQKRFSNISEEDCLKSLHLVLSHHQIFVGEKAVPEIMNRLKVYRWLHIFFKIPITRIILYALYRKIANNRFIISMFIKPLIRE